MKTKKIAAKGGDGDAAKCDNDTTHKSTNTKQTNKQTNKGTGKVDCRACCQNEEGGCDGRRGTRKTADPDKTDSDSS
jgi:hypothetical protein